MCSIFLVIILLLAFRCQSLEGNKCFKAAGVQMSGYCFKVVTKCLEFLLSHYAMGHMLMPPWDSEVLAKTRQQPGRVWGLEVIWHKKLLSVE